LIAEDRRRCFLKVKGSGYPAVPDNDRREAAYVARIETRGMLRS